MLCTVLDLSHEKNDKALKTKGGSTQYWQDVANEVAGEYKVITLIVKQTGEMWLAFITKL